MVLNTNFRLTFFRKHRSEYYKNFKSPQKFSYDHGAWHGADPAHAEYRKVKS